MIDCRMKKANVILHMSDVSRNKSRGIYRSDTLFVFWVPADRQLKLKERDPPPPPLTPTPPRPVLALPAGTRATHQHKFGDLLQKREHEITVEWCQYATFYSNFPQWCNLRSRVGGKKKNNNKKTFQTFSFRGRESSEISPRPRVDASHVT